MANNKVQLGVNDSATLAKQKAAPVAVPTPTSAPTPIAPTPQQTLADVKVKADKVQADLNESIKSGSIANQPINGKMLAPATPIKPVTAPTPTNGAALAGTIDAQAQQYAASIVSDQALSDSKNAKDAALKALTDRITGNKGETGLTDEYYKGTVDPAKKELDDINNQIRAEQHSLDRRVQAIEKNPRGATAQGIDQEVRAVTKESLATQADLSIIQMAKQDNYFGAKEIADRKVAAQLEDQAAELKSLELTYNENKSAFDKNEQRQFETQQAERTRLLTKEATELKAVNDLAINALQNGAPVDVVRKMQQATTQDEAISYGGNYIGKLDRDTQLLQQQSIRADISKKAADAKAASDAQKNIEQVQTLLGNADPVSSKAALATLLSNPAITAGTKGRITPAISVLNAVDELANSNIEGKFTGIGVGGQIKEGIKGLFNMKDKEAINNEQAIEAINLKVQQWASGAALTEAQTKQVAKFTPTKGDSDAQVKAKSNGLYNFMLNQAEADLLTEGINVQFPAVNLFEISDLYAKASPEQKKEIAKTYFKK